MVKAMIGLEVHVQLPTKSKMFCSCPTQGDDTPNSRVCPGCLGMPGAKVSLNKKAVEYGIALAKMLKCTVPDTIWFSRKIYYYPDLSTHYQITQFDKPVGEKGSFSYTGSKGPKTVRITRAHLEEDPGKTKKTAEGNALIDYNRSGTPLIEIVTEPDLKSPTEAREFLSALLVSIRNTIDLPADSEFSIRCDCNISIEGGERVEVKNVTGLKNAEDCLLYEAKRQLKVMKSGQKVERETRHWDELKKVTTGARKKEFEADYGYVGEPDLGVYRIAELAKTVRIKETPVAMAERIGEEYGIGIQSAKQLVSTSVDLAALYEEVAKATDAKTAFTWCSGVVSANWKHYEPSMKDGIVGLVKQFASGSINDAECSARIKSLITGQEIEEAAEVSGDLAEIVSKIVDENPQVIEDYRKNEKAANRIIGSVKKATGTAYSSADIVAAVKKAIESRL